MFNLFEGESTELLDWKTLSDISTGRKNLGEEMPVLVYRLFQYTIRDELTQRFGKEIVVEIFRNAGKVAGKEFAINMLDLQLPYNEFIALLQNVLKESKIGVFRMEEFNVDTGEMIMTISEDLDCSGLPVLGDTVCNYDEGFLAGVIEEYTKDSYSVREIDCWATGARVCRFKAEKLH